MGIRVWAPTLEGLVPPAAEGLYAVIGRLVPEAGGDRVKLEFTGGDQATLLRDFLAELLRRFERDGTMIADPRAVRYMSGELVVEGFLPQVDLARSELNREAKAVTYHDLALRRTAEGVEVRLIVDV